MRWIDLEELDPTYSGYAWVQFWRTHGSPTEPEWTHLCRIWTHHTSKSKWWTGWDLDSDDSLNHNYNLKVILVEKPE